MTAACVNLDGCIPPTHQPSRTRPEPLFDKARRVYCEAAVALACAEFGGRENTFEKHGIGIGKITLSTSRGHRENN
jgi:hypothetical protein